MNADQIRWAFELGNIGRQPCNHRLELIQPPAVEVNGAMWTDSDARSASNAETGIDLRALDHHAIHIHLYHSQRAFIIALRDALRLAATERKIDGSHIGIQFDIFRGKHGRDLDGCCSRRRQSLLHIHRPLRRAR